MPTVAMLSMVLGAMAAPPDWKAGLAAHERGDHEVALRELTGMLDGLGQVPTEQRAYVAFALGRSAQRVGVAQGLTGLMVTAVAAFDACADDPTRGYECRTERELTATGIGISVDQALAADPKLGPLAEGWASELSMAWPESFLGPYTQATVANRLGKPEAELTYLRASFDHIAAGGGPENITLRANAAVRLVEVEFLLLGLEPARARNQAVRKTLREVAPKPLDQATIAQVFKTIDRNIAEVDAFLAEREAALQGPGATPQERTQFAMSLAKLGLTERAVAIVTEQAAAYPNSVEAAASLGLVHFLASQRVLLAASERRTHLEAARTSLERVVVLDPAHARALSVLSWLSRELGDTDAAARYDARFQALPAAVREGVPSLTE